MFLLLCTFKIFIKYTSVLSLLMARVDMARDQSLSLLLEMEDESMIAVLTMDMPTVYLQ